MSCYSLFNMFASVAASGQVRLNFLNPSIGSYSSHSSVLHTQKRTRHCHDQFVDCGMNLFVDHSSSLVGKFSYSFSQRSSPVKRAGGSSSSSKSPQISFAFTERRAKLSYPPSFSISLFREIERKQPYPARLMDRPTRDSFAGSRFV